MKATRTGTLLLLGLVLAGCQAPSSSGDSSASGECNATAVRDLIGKRASPELLDQARRDSGAEVARLLRPGDIVTLEYNARRLTLTADEEGLIERLSCG